jgi:integrase/recombinase XerD
MTVHDLVTHYVTFRRTLGERCETNERMLRAFSRAVGPQTLVAGISAVAVSTYLNGKGPITSTWYCRYHALKGFFRFAVSRGHRADAPLPTVLPKRSSPFIPHIYSRDELRRLLDAIPTDPGSRTRIEPCTFRAILLTLYGTGLRVGEALALTAADVDLTNAVLTVRGTKFFKSRLVPMGRDLARVLSEYNQWSATVHPLANPGSRFFRGKQGATIAHHTLGDAFQRLRARAGVCRSAPARYQPRLHDLRHTFAVHRLTTWYQHGADVQRLLHHLSTYLGHDQLSATQVYLTTTPELLAYAAARFERYVRGEGSHA